MSITRQQIIGAVTVVLGFIFKPILTRVYAKWLEDSPNAEAFLIKITFGQYRKKIRAKQAVDRHEFERRENNDVIDDRINSYLQTLVQAYGFNRATFSSYRYLGDEFPENPVISDFVKINITVTHEWRSDNIAAIKDEWKDQYGGAFALAFYNLHYSEKGYICIGQRDSDDLTSAQNLYNVDESFRFCVGVSLWDGVVALSHLFQNENRQPLTDKQIKEIWILVKKIGLASKKLIN